MAKEAAENEENEENAAAPELPMFSKKGKIFVIAISAIQLLIFAGLFYFVTMPEKVPEPFQEPVSTLNNFDLSAERISIDQPIIVSIPTNELATEFRHLAVTLELVLGRIAGEEMADFDLATQLTNESFLDTANHLTPFVKDRVNSIAMDYSYLQLQQQTTKENFKARLKNELNNLLQKYGMPPRINQVLLTSFIFSD